ncbi:Putative carrier protein PET8 [Monoraphidium neglectum]|uniref:Putative carrier protein PET8 n=1 Tax=Monoraphidium neglectum TaxID=145388 RepID=A0A0D2KXP5_9CHLO|nr:Putative carrier protein PET8 [Monoraphidium neglectum]KIZ00039.1 Putative carrier protein PET8 [Monoraphidium neglectum]|eukprot:XP_013899058.1 Putative carrier protein PET8 [Monoraphidium neglectum]
MKVRMQTGNLTGRAGAASAAKGVQLSLNGAAREVASLYRGVLSAATGAGVIIGAYFAFYSTTKRFLRQRTSLGEGQMAFVSGGVAAVGSGVVKVPIAVCIRSVQAGVYPNVVAAARSITGAAGFSGLFTGFLPTIMEDVPDMAVKFAVYETLRCVHARVSDGRQPSTLEDLLMGGSAGAAAAAATTPLDVVKTRMMCSASTRPTFAAAVRGVAAEGQGARAFFRGVGPRALSNGLNSAVFFCFFEAIRRVLLQRQAEAAAAAAAAAGGAAAGAGKQLRGASRRRGAEPVVQQQQQQQQQQLAQLQADLAEQGGARRQRLARSKQQQQQQRSQVGWGAGGSGVAGGGAAACLSLALPVGRSVRWW